MADNPTETLDAIDRELEPAFAAVKDENELRNVYARFLGREGSLNAVMKRIPELPGAERKPFGQRVNALKQRAEKHREDTETRLRKEARARELNRPAIDVTLPGRGHRPGKIHPLNRVVHELVDVFVSMGFDVAEGPETEFASLNFERLNFPKDHPALDMQATFFLSDGAHAPEADRPVLRTHTSPVQLREMLSREGKPPFQCVMPGVVYRCDDDVTHSPMFLQIEGLVVDRGIHMGHLKGTLDAFVERLFGKRLSSRFRASFFPFTEPSAEMDIECPFCHGKDPSCRVCKGGGWMEVLGCGMVHPTVLKNGGVDPEEFTGFAFGMGIDRLAMLRYKVPDIRLLYENDVRFLESL